jgi:redox-sensitive bicupin YhaK (pirin superfamily)
MAMERHPGRETELGPLKIWRALPARGRRLIGPWCFLDRYGPIAFVDQKPMDVATHPHIGIQTVSWLLEGEVVHHDSIGSEAVVRPGEVNIMTSGRGIAHAEETPPANEGRLNGVQLWIALPNAHRNVAPSFEHVAEVPMALLRGCDAQIFTGVGFGTSSPAHHYSEMIGADLFIHDASTVPLNPLFEHGIFLMQGTAMLDGEPLELNTLYYLPPGALEMRFTSPRDARILLLGGPPFEEAVLMWWNFVARRPEEIAAAREDWENRRRFGDVPAYRGPRLRAPALMRLAEPNPAS